VDIDAQAARDSTASDIWLFKQHFSFWIADEQTDRQTDATHQPSHASDATGVDNFHAGES